MIARHWRGRVPAAKAEDDLRLMAEVALPDYLLELEPDVRHYEVIEG